MRKNKSRQQFHSDLNRRLTHTPGIFTKADLFFTPLTVTGTVFLFSADRSTSWAVRKKIA